MRGPLDRLSVSTIAVHAHGTAQIRDVWRRYLVVLLGLTTIFLIVTFAFWPWPYTFAVEHLVLPEYETAFAFRGGSVVVGEESTLHPSTPKFSTAFGLEFKCQ